MGWILDAAGQNNRDSMEAINTYFLRTQAVTPAARTLKESWVKWYSDLGWIDRSKDDIAREAINRRNAFNYANAKSQAEYEKVTEVVTTGHSTMPHLGPKDAAGNFPKVPGRTVASAGKAVTPGARPTIRRGSRGEPVKAWQAIIGVKQDGSFGPQTEVATKAWQGRHPPLKPDGIVGSQTWAMALGNQPMGGAQALVTPVTPDTVPAARVPSGAVAPTNAAKHPIPPPKDIVAVADPIVNKSEKPLEVGPGTVKPSSANPVQQASIIPGWDKLPSWGKTTLILGSIGSAVAYVFKRR